MKYLFQENCRKIIESVSMANCLLAFDFDGTLAPIVNNPDSARLSKLSEALLKKIQKKYPVAIISGRSLADLKKRVPPGFQLVGNHGLEGVFTNSHSLDRLEKSVSQWKKDFYSNHKLLALGVSVEDKLFSLALHYRNSNQKKLAKQKILESCLQILPHPRIILGKSVVNIIPPGAPHKGVALLEIMNLKQLRSALYIGDDDTDEDVFALPDERIITIRIGAKRESSAQFYLKRQNEIHKLLKILSELR